MSADPVAELTAFARSLRERGVAADASRVVAAAGALDHVDVLDQHQVYWTTRLTLCSEPDDLPRFDAAFAEWFGDRPPPAAAESTVQIPGGAGSSGDGAAGRVERVTATALETLRTRDVAALTAAERAEVRRLIALLAPSVGTRRSVRRRPGGRAGVDPVRTMRTMLRAGGEPIVLVRWRRREKPRRLVLLVDVSGSMAPYADWLLLFAYGAVRVRPFATEQPQAQSPRADRAVGWQCAPARSGRAGHPAAPCCRRPAPPPTPARTATIGSEAEQVQQETALEETSGIR